MKKTLVVFAGDGILRIGQIESNYAFFHHYSIARAYQEILDGPDRASGFMTRTVADF